MARELNMERANRIFNALVQSLDKNGWNYDKHEENLLIKSAIKGEDLPIEFIVVVRPKQEVVQFLSRLPFVVPEDKRVDCALAICIANNGLVDGSFDYNLTDGEITFRLTSSYRDSILGAELFEYMIMCSASTIDNYNDKFFMLGKGMITIEQFIEQENA